MKNNIRFTSLLLIIISMFSLKIEAQFSGESVFDINVLHELRLEFSDSDYWEQMEANYASAPDEFTSIPYIMTTVTLDGELIDSVGARFKGFTSYISADKKPIKLDFNEFVAGQRLDGLRKLNLNNATADPSMQRDVVAYYMLREMGVSAPRTSFARVYINDTYWGIYQLIEQIDKEFLQDNFAYAGGNLYKNKGWNKLEFLGSNAFNYSPPYLKKTNKDENDWTGFINFIDVLNNTSDVEFKEEIQKVLNVHQYLKSLAVDVATNNWDSYLEHGRNWYVYEDIESNLINWIPWDYNLCFDAQLDFGDGGSSEGCEIWADYFAMRNGSTTVSFFDDSWKEGGSATYLWDFDDDNTSEEENPIHTYEEHGIYNVCVTINIATCEETRCKLIDTNFDPNECLSITSGEGPSEANKAFQQILSWVPECCEVWSEDCEDWYQILGGGSDGSSNYPIDQQGNDGVLIKRLLSIESFRSQYYSYFCELMDKVMTEDELFDIVNFNFSLVDQAVEEDDNFLYDYERFRLNIGADSISGLKKIIIDRIEVLQSELGDLYDCSEAQLSLNQGEIVINELVASNDSTSGNQDDQGHYNDWVEMFNNSEKHIDLSRLYLSNDNTNLRKWKFPAGSILAPGEYRILWMDEDEKDNGYHASFKLPKAGASLFLTNLDGSIVDEVIYEEQTTNIAYARIPNGTGDFVNKEATFGFNNEAPTAVTEGEIVKTEFKVIAQPNPTSQFIDIKLNGFVEQMVTATLYTSTGTEVAKSNFPTTGFTLDLASYTPGVYILKISDSKGSSVNKMIVRIQ